MWILLSILTAIAESAKDITAKIGLKKSDDVVLSFLLRFYSIPVIALPLLFETGTEIQSGFWTNLLIAGTLHVFATIFYIKAIKNSELSKVAPLITFTPLFLIFTSPVLINEYAEPIGIIGIILIVMGSYVLNISKKSKHGNSSGFLSPIKALFYDKGARYMLAVALIFSITANLDKKGLMLSAPYLWIFSINLFLTIVIFAYVLVSGRKKLLKQSFTEKYTVYTGLLAGLTIVFQIYAVKLAAVSYVIGIKRSSTIMSVLAGVFIFKEKNMKVKITGSGIMLIGVLLIILF